MYTAERLSCLLAAVVAGFALIGLSYLIPNAFQTLAFVLFIIGAIAVVIFSVAIIFRALAALLKRYVR
jgi:hypothetical protein